MTVKVKKPKLAPPPYKLNSFPAGFAERLAKKIIVLLATKKKPSISGKEWEQLFAECIDANWQSSNVGLRDVYKDTSCWSAKTIEGPKKVANKKTVRLISGRNNTGFSFDIDVTGSSDPQDVGRRVLEIWNTRVNDAKKEFTYLRQVVLIRSKDYKEYVVFETAITTYNADDYTFTWNENNNVEGRRKSDNKHVFTWQKEGKQFTIIEDVPSKHVHIKLKKLPEPLNDERILEAIGYNDDSKADWFSAEGGKANGAKIKNSK